MSIAVIGPLVTQVDSPDPTFTTGARGAVDSTAGTGVGVKEYMYVRYAASTAFTVGQAVAIDGDGLATPLTVTNSAPGAAVGRRVGVVVAAASSSTAAQYAWVQIYGKGSVLVNNGCVRNTVLNTTGSAGQLDDDAGAGSEVVDGIVLNSTASGTEATSCSMSYPFVGRTL